MAGVLVGCIVSDRVTMLMFIALSIFVHSSHSPVLLFRRRLLSVCGCS